MSSSGESAPNTISENCLNVCSIKTKLKENLNCKRDKAGVDNLIYRNIGVLLRGIDILVGSQFRFPRRKWQPTPVLLPGNSHGRGSLVGCRLRGRTESDMTEVT